MTLYHDHLFRPALQQAPDRISDAGEPAVLVGRDRPRAGIEGDRIDVDAAHAIAQLDIVADLIERIGALQRHQRGRCQRLVEKVGRRDVEIDDIALARDVDHRSRQVERHHGANADREADRKPGAEARTAPVLDQHDLAAIRTAAHAPQETAVVVGDVDDLHVARPLVDREPLGAAHLNFDVGREAAETLVLVGCDDDLPASAHDRAVTLLDVGVTALISGPLPLRAHLIDAGGALRTWRSSALRTRHSPLPRTSLAGQTCSATLLWKALLSRQSLLSGAA